MASGILFDLDGVLYHASAPIEGAAEAVAWARAESIPHLFVTNTTSRPRRALVEKLHAFGIEADTERILTPPAAAAAWLREQPQGAVALFVPEATRVEFQGLSLLADGAERGASYVVVGDLAEKWTYAVLNRAFRLLHANAEARLVALGMTRFWQTEEGASLDVAAFVMALSHASGREPIVMGKPAAPFFEAGCRQLGLPPSEVLVVGDDVVTDVGGAQSAGLVGALVRTGKFREADLEGAARPDLVLDTVASLPSRWTALG